MAHRMESAPGARTLIDGRWRDYFSGTGYLGLQGHPGLIEASAAALRRYGLTTATSRGGFGEHPVFDEVEAAAARFFGQERALYYVSAFIGSEVLLEGLRDYERVYLDEHAHYSVRMAAAASGQPVHFFSHCDPGALEDVLQFSLQPEERPLVLTDGVFPISGDIAPVRDYVAILSAYDGATLCLDDAHSSGVLGARGRGTLEHLHVEPGPVRVVTATTLSKALGGHGGVIANTAALVEVFWREATSLAGSSPSPIPAAAASAWALDYVREHPALIESLRRNVARARDGFRALGWSVFATPVPIICLAARDGLDLARIQAALFDRDLCVAHIKRYSGVPAGGALRVAIFATHTGDQIDRLLEEVGRLL